LRIDGKTRVCAVIGNPVEHSLSPAIHNAAFQELGLNFCYVPFHVEDLGQAMAGVRGLNLAGLSVTIPHKVAVLQYLDEIETTAQHIGSVNTVVHREGRLIGYNTDGRGALRALQEAGVILEGKRVVILGSGGAARAIAFMLGKVPQLREMILLGIKRDELDRLGKDLVKVLPISVSWEYLDEESLARHVPQSDGVIHCTPVGMEPSPDQNLVPPSLLSGHQFAFDIVYTPFRTRFLKEAQQAGCAIIPGMEMFLHQAAFQFELWTDHQAPLERMREVVTEYLG